MPNDPNQVQPPAPPPPPPPGQPPAPPLASAPGAPPADLAALFQSALTTLAGGQVATREAQEQAAQFRVTLEGMKSAADAAEARSKQLAAELEAARREQAAAVTRHAVAGLVALGADPRVAESVIVPALGAKASDLDAIKAFRDDPKNASLFTGAAANGGGQPFPGADHVTGTTQPQTIVDSMIEQLRSPIIDQAKKAQIIGALGHYGYDIDTVFRLIGQNNRRPGLGLGGLRG